MGEYIFDPAETTIREYLLSVQDAPVVVNAPEVLPPKFVQLQKVGGNDALVTDRPMVTFICWDESRALAARFAELIRAHMRSCTELAEMPVYRVRSIGGPTYRPDPETKRDRYQFTLELQVRGRNFAP